MTNTQRMKHDMETMDKREAVDRAVEDSRIRNDELTRERRSKADKIVVENRIRNDETTADRREIKDENPSASVAVLLLILAVLVIGALFIFI